MHQKFKIFSVCIHFFVLRLTIKRIIPITIATSIKPVHTPALKIPAIAEQPGKTNIAKDDNKTIMKIFIRFII